MSDIGKPERETQNRVIKLFCDELGYRHLGDWTDRAGNSNIEEGLLTAYLGKVGYSPAQISAAIYKLRVKQTTIIARSTAITKPCMACCATACR